MYSAFRERNAVVAQKWAALAESCRKEWAEKAEAVCSAALQVCMKLIVCVCDNELCTLHSLKDS